MAFTLGKEQKQFIHRMIRERRFNSESEVVREALLRMEAMEYDYLHPPSLTAAQVENIYGRKDEKREGSFGVAAFDAVRRVARRTTV